MIYASTPPVNDDPKPWRTDPDGKEARSAERWRLRPYCGEYAPRPEFDRPRAHEANRRLLAFRDEVRLHIEAGEQGLAMPSLASSWSERNDFADSVTEAEYEHSRRVLERLARL